MTTTEIRDALTQVQHAVPVPPVDEVAFRARVRGERRRRTTRRVLAGGAGLVAAAAVVAAGMLEDTGSSPGRHVAPPPADRPSATREGLAVVRLEGRLQVLQPGNGSYAGDLRIRQVVGRSAAGDAVVIDGDAHLWRVPLADDGEPGDPVPLADGRPVVNAWLDEAGTTLAFVDRGNTLHLRPLGSDRDTENVQLLEQQTDLVATDGTSWIEDEGDRLSLRHPDDSSEVDVDGDPVSADLTRDVLAVRTTQGTELWDVRQTLPDRVTPPRRVARLDGGVGSLAPDGRAYAAAGAGGLAVMDSDDGVTWSTRPVDLDDDLTPLAIHWQDADRFLVLATSAARAGNHVLLDCSVALGRCDERYDDPTGTLEIPTQ